MVWCEMVCYAICYAICHPICYAVIFISRFLQAFTIGLVVSCCKGRRSYIGDIDSSDEESEDENDRPVDT